MVTMTVPKAIPVSKGKTMSSAIEYLNLISPPAQRLEKYRS